jgi:hypothetical protein
VCEPPTPWLWALSLAQHHCPTDLSRQRTTFHPASIASSKGKTLKKTKQTNTQTNKNNNKNNDNKKNQKLTNKNV